MAKVNGTSLECLTQCCLFWENKMQMVPTNLKLFILESRYDAKASLSSIRFIACMIGKKSSYTPSTALLVDSQRVLHAFLTFFSTADLALWDSFIFRQDSCALTRTAVSFGELAKNFQSCKEDSFHLCDILRLVTCTSECQGKPVADTLYIQQLTVKLLQSGSYSSFLACHNLCTIAYQTHHFQNVSYLDCPGYIVQLFRHCQTTTVPKHRQ